MYVCLRNVASPGCYRSSTVHCSAAIVPARGQRSFTFARDDARIPTSRPNRSVLLSCDFIAKVDKTSAAVGGLVIGTSAQIDRAAGELIRVAERR